MSDPVTQVRQFAVTVNPGTAIASAVRTALTFDDGWVVRWVEVEVPPGPKGVLGFHVDSSKTQLLPYWGGGPNTWFVWNDKQVRYDMEGLPDTGDWSVVAYNLGNNPHTFWVRFGIWQPPTTFAPPVALVPASALAGTLAGS